LYTDDDIICTGIRGNTVIAAEVAGTSPIADKSLFTTLIPEALRAGVITHDAAGNHAASSFLATPIGVLPVSVSGPVTVAGPVQVAQPVQATMDNGVAAGQHHKRRIKQNLG